MKSKLVFIHTLSPLHAGTGQGVGVIDLPIAREKATNLPFLPGSSVKGTIRDEFNDDADLRDKIFGPERSSDFASAIQFSDFTLLFLPVRSLSGTFAYVTSPYVLQRFRRDAGVDHSLPIPDVADSDCLVGPETVLKLETKVCLEDLDLEPRQPATQWGEEIASLAFQDDDPWQELLKKRVCIVSDNVFNFLLNTGTEVTARIRLEDETKTTVKGALWYEEALPTESVLFGIALANPNVKTDMNATAVLEEIEKRTKMPLQFGGKATVGRGICRLSLCDRTDKAASAGGND